MRITRDRKGFWMKDGETVVAGPCRSRAALREAMQAKHQEALFAERARLRAERGAES